MDLSILVKILLGGYLTLWRISRGYLQEMMGLKYLAGMTSEELSGIIIR